MSNNPETSNTTNKNSSMLDTKELNDDSESLASDESGDMIGKMQK